MGGADKRRLPDKLPHADDALDMSEPYLPVTKVYKDGPPADPGDSKLVHKLVTKQYNGPQPGAVVCVEEIEAGGSDATVRTSGTQYRPTTALYTPSEARQDSSQSDDSTTGRYQPRTQTFGVQAVADAQAPLVSEEVSVLDGPLAGTPYKFIAKIGAGGMGDVYEALDVEVNERVVIKLVRDTEPWLVERMDREADALARLRHPNIVQVSRYSRNAQGRPYLAMERLYGSTLRQEVKERGALPVEEAVSLVRQVLDGLGAAHVAGLLHRDIKLENLFLCDSEGGERTIKIIDFGLTKMTARQADAARPLAYPTADNQFVGTPRYAAPEQVHGTIDERTDLYATGLVLYALLTGREPFDDIRGHQELLAAQQNRTLDFRFPQEVSPHLERVLRRSVAKDPNERYSSAADFLDALDSALSKASGQETSELDLAAVGAGEKSSPSEGARRATGAWSRRIPLGPQFIAAVLASAVVFALLTSVIMRWVMAGR